MIPEVIGREGELAAIQAFFDRDADGLRALVLEGDAGIGKSTLWLAAVAVARERSVHVLTSRPAETERTMPSLVLGDLFRDTPPDLLAALPGPRRRAFEAALLLGDAPDATVDPRALGAAILTLLPLLSTGRPVVIAIDDDQWMDTSSAATLAFAIRRAVSQPVMLLLSRRLDGVPTPSLADVVEPGSVERLRIGSLSLGATQALLQQRVGISFSRSMLLQLHEVSGGNPFYVLELARAQSAESGRNVTTLLNLPPSLERLVSGRLASLGGRTREALLLIAANGRLQTGLLQPLRVEPADLALAQQAHVIATSGDVIGFTHPLLASAVYQGATGEERRVAHRKLASVVDDNVHRGRHLALGSATPDPNLAAAVEAAATSARDRGLPLVAAELEEHALRLTPPDATAEQHRRAIATARAYSDAGDGRHAREIAEKLLAASKSGLGRAEVLVLLAELVAHGDPQVAVRLLDEALPEAVGIPRLQARIHAVLAETGRLVNGRAWAERHAAASLRLADQLDDDGLRAMALLLLARFHHEQGDSRAIELAERAYELAASQPDPELAKGAGWGLADVLVYSGEADRARDWLLERLADEGERDEIVRWELLWYLIWVEFISGRWAAASEYSDQAREISAQYGIEPPQDHQPPALIALHRGDLDTARFHAQRGLSLAGGQLLGYLSGTLAICDLWAGRLDAALSNFDEAETTADQRGWEVPTLRWWRDSHVEALIQIGRLDDAARMLDELEGAAERMGLPRVSAQAVRCRGRLAAARGDLPRAIALFEEAVPRHEAAGDPFGQARALLDLGIARRRTRQKRTAREALEAALTGFEVLGAVRWADTARAEIARIGGRTRIQGLSPSEQSVAVLVAEGRTNREIASALFLGERTVAGHLTNIYSKLGIRSRTELARQLPPEGTR